jgi:hypothetical protein
MYNQHSEAFDAKHASIPARPHVIGDVLAFEKPAVEAMKISLLRLSPLIRRSVELPLASVVSS